MVGICINLVLIPALVIAAGYFLRALAVKVLPLWLLRFWVYPGTAVHELSHALACIPAMASVQEVTLFRLDGSGEVKHGPSKLGRFGDMLIAMAPLVGGVVVLWLLNLVFGSPLQYAGVVTGNGAADPLFILHVAELTFEDCWRSMTTANWGDWRTYALIYLVFSISLNLAPSPQDLKNATWGLILVLGGAIAWLVIEHFLGIPIADSPLARVTTSLLGLSHILFFYFALSYALLGVLSLIGKLLSPKGGN